MTPEQIARGKSRSVPFDHARIIAEATADCATKAVRWKQRAKSAEDALEWALAEIDGRTRYDTDAQRDACLEKARAVLQSRAHLMEAGDE